MHVEVVRRPPAVQCYVHVAEHNAARCTTDLRQSRGRGHCYSLHLS